MRSGMAHVKRITQFYLPPTRLSTNGMNHLAFIYSVSIRQIALPERGSTHPITAHYSFIDLERMKG